ncbi:MAG: hydrogenase 4 subunit B [Chloroflexi bacterium]|nr:hydrogenase 4 subunit B [Chloroflexota bacterium]
MLPLLTAMTALYVAAAAPGEEPTVLPLLTAMTTLYLAAAALGLAGARAPLGLRLAHVGTAAAALAGVALAVTGLVGGGGTLDLGWLNPFARLALRLDGLAAFFLLLISAVALAAAIYALGYARATGPGQAATLGGALPLFCLAMSLVPLADDAFVFLLLWETMSLASYALVVSQHDEPAARGAGFLYLTMTHFGTGFILIAFLLLAAPAGSFGFEALRVVAPDQAPWLRDLVFLAALIGFGAKAGLAPLHVWLPRAHPIAPSHVSALMSGVMVKTGIYGLLRVGWEILGPGPAWWGLALLALGAASAVLGVLYAYVEGDFKRLLAFSTIENVGLIALGLGVAFTSRGLGLAAVAALGLAAALLHALNHALFKSLLFFGAGAVHHATHTRDLEKLGGLIRRMPATAALLVAGFLALAALPPLNGFISEWVLLQSLLSLGLAAPGWMAVVAAVAVAALALTGALALATSVKVIGIGFLGVPRSTAPSHAHEAPAAMLGPMAALAGLCVLLGVVPAVAMGAVGAAGATLGAGGASLALAAWPALGVSTVATINPLAIALGLALLAPLPWLALRVVAGPVGRRVSEPWVCGITLRPRMQYTSAAFAKPIRLIFRAIIQPVRTVEATYLTTGDYFLHTMHTHGETRPLIERYLYATVHRGVLALARATRVIQNGSTRIYLTYVFVTLVVLLLVAR